jgi:hypothetical protein
MMMVVMLMLMLVVVFMVVVVVFMFMLMVMVVMMLTFLLTVDRHMKTCSRDTALDSGNGLDLHIGYAKSVKPLEEPLLVVNQLIQRG